MAAYLILLLAVLSRFLPHALHTAAWGVTALGGGLLFFGSRNNRATRWYAAAFAVLAIAVSDWALSTRVYGFPFHAGGYLVSWAWYAMVCVAASVWLHGRSSAGRVLTAAVAAPTGFFLLSNGTVWAGGTMYAHSAAGLLECYTAGLPFYRNDLLATLAVSGILFGLPALARRMHEASAGAAGTVRY